MNKPKHFLIFKLIGFVSLMVALAGLVLLIVGFGDFEHNWFLFGMLMLPIGFFGAALGLVNGFMPEISRATARSASYIQKQNKDALKEIANTSAEINKEAVATIASAVSEGLGEKMFCKHCGKRIDADSKFCSFCGKEQ